VAALHQPQRLRRAIQWKNLGDVRAQRAVDDPARQRFDVSFSGPPNAVNAYVCGIFVSSDRITRLASPTAASRCVAPRVVLVDDVVGARAAVVAHWLQRRGFEIAILLHDFSLTANHPVATT
jgi:hypothetical protein